MSESVAVSPSGHRPVLLAECIEALQIKADGTYVDCTFGRGGHSRAILEKLGPHGRLLALDKDPQAVKEAQQLAQQDERFSIQRGTFTMLKQLVTSCTENHRVDGILLDLGVSSPQLDDAERGFSFQQDGPLDMRMDTDQHPSAAEWLAVAEAGEIARVLKEYGEERFAKRIANAIVRTRDVNPITRTQQLAEIVLQASPRHERHKHPATRTFQAIRIFINRELDELHDVLQQAVEVLCSGGRLAVISFHSLEDRIVKRFFRQASRGPDVPRDFPLPASEFVGDLKIIGKAIKAGVEELRLNPRARSAVLRIAEHS